MCLSTYMVNFIFHSFSFVIIIIHYLPSDPRLVNLFMIWPVLLSEEFWNEVFFLFYQNFFVILLFSLIWAHIKLKENSRFHAALTRKNFWFLYFFLSNVFNLLFCLVFLSWVTQRRKLILSDGRSSIFFVLSPFDWYMFVAWRKKKRFFSAPTGFISVDGYKKEFY